MMIEIPDDLADEVAQALDIVTAWNRGHASRPDHVRACLTDRADRLHALAEQVRNSRSDAIADAGAAIERGYDAARECAAAVAYGDYERTGGK